MIEPRGVGVAELGGYIFTSPLASIRARRTLDGMVEPRCFK